MRNPAYIHAYNCVYDSTSSVVEWPPNRRTSQNRTSYIHTQGGEEMVDERSLITLGPVMCL